MCIGPDLFRALFKGEEEMPTLCLRDQELLRFKEEDGKVVAVGKTDMPELLPVPLMLKLCPESFNAWLSRRRMPLNREGRQEIVKERGDRCLYNNNRLSLSDQYWIKYGAETWKKLNFFTNRLNTDVGDLFFKPWTVTRPRINTNSPDLTTNGVLKKRWIKKADGSTWLVKAGSRITNQEPLSEILVSAFLERIKIIPFVRYDYYVEGVTLCSISRNVIDQNTELVPLTDFYSYEKRDPAKESINGHVMRMCDMIFGGVPGMEEYLDAMAFIDLVTGQSDRNLGNVAIIRDSRTMKAIKPAPLFDFGAAYWSKGKIEKSLKADKLDRLRKKLMKKMGDKFDMEAALKDIRFHSAITSYPYISEQRKAELIDAIDYRNKELLRVREKEEYDVPERQ